MWLTSVAAGEVAWCSVGVIWSDANVHWHTERMPSYRRLHPDLGPPSRDDFKELESYTIESPTSLANLSKTIFQSSDLKNHQRRDPYLYRLIGDKRIRVKYHAAAVEDFKALSPVRKLLARGRDPKWAEILGRCVPPGGTTMLIPFVHWDGSDPRYVAAIVVCADINSKVWARLPELKALLLPLAEPLRHAPEYGILPEVSNTNELMLLRVLLLGKGEQLFQGAWHHFETFKNKPRAAERLIDRFSSVVRLFDGLCRCRSKKFPVCCESAFEFCKSLFYFPSQFDKGSLSRPASRTGTAHSAAMAAKFMQNTGDIPIEPAVRSGAHERFKWPATPGILGAIPLIRLAKSMGADRGRLLIDRAGFGLSLRTKRSEFDLRQLSRSVWRMAWRIESGGDLSGSVAAAMWADLSGEIGRFKMGREVLSNFEQLLRPTTAPLMFPAFQGRDLTLWWGEETASSSDRANRKGHEMLSVGYSEGNGKVPGLYARLRDFCRPRGILFKRVDGGNGRLDCDVIIAHDSALYGKHSKGAKRPAAGGRRRIFICGSTTDYKDKPFLSHGEGGQNAGLIPQAALQEITPRTWGNLLEFSLSLMRDWPESYGQLKMRMRKVRGLYVA